MLMLAFPTGGSFPKHVLSQVDQAAVPLKGMVLQLISSPGFESGPWNTSHGGDLLHERGSSSCCQPLLKQLDEISVEVPGLPTFS